MDMGGIFLGGMAKSAQRREENKLASRGLDLQERGLGLQEKQYQDAQNAASAAAVEKQLNDTIKVIGDLIKAADTPERKQALRGTVGALTNQAAFFASQLGRDPTTLVQRIQTEFDIARTAEEQAQIEGKAAGAKELAAAPSKAEAAGMVTGAEATARVTAENSPTAIQGAARKAGAVAEATARGTAKGTPQKAQTDAGKVIEDRERFIAQYGENSPQVKAFDEATSAGDVKLSDVAGLRKEYVQNSKEFVTIRDAFGKIAEVAGALRTDGQPSAAADMALIFGYMKMLDPGSTVREGEFATAQNAAGVPERIQNLYNKALNGSFLAPEQRQDFLDRAEETFRVQLRNQVKSENEYRRLAERQKMRPEDVIVDLIGEYRQALPKDDKGSNDSDPLGIRGKK